MKPQAGGARFDLAGYLTELCRQFERAFLVGTEIEMSLEFEPCASNADLGLRAGLIVHELALNAVKHAFADGTGRIIVSLRQRPDRRAVLSVSDDGCGFEPADGVNPSGSVLVERLAESVGDLTVERLPTGMRFTVDFDPGA